MTSRTSPLGTRSSAQTASTAVELAAAHEDRETSEQTAFVLEEQVVAPVHHCPQGLLAGQGGTGAPGEEPEAVVEPFRHGGEGQRPETGGGELNGQGQAV